jgi:hypothetical protein
MIKITSRGIPELVAYLETLGRGVKITATRAFDEFLIGDATHGLKHAPERVWHGADNPYRWQSEKQRRAFFATDGFGGGIPTIRTGAIVGGWQYKETDSNWTSSTIYNDVPGAKFVQGEFIQRGHVADGWRQIADIINTNKAGAIRHANAKVKEWLKAHKK